MDIKRTRQEIDEQIGLALEQIEKGHSKYFGMTYEEGVDNALRWVLGDSNDAPMSED